MKAKELKNKAQRIAILKKGNLERYVFTKEEMSIFWSQLCKEQRELCSVLAYKNNHGKYDEAGIENAPEPDIE